MFPRNIFVNTERNPNSTTQGHLTYDQSSSIVNTDTDKSEE